MDFISIDKTKLDKAKVIAWLADGGKLLEPAIITPGNIDKVFLDRLDFFLQSAWDVFFAREDGELVVGAATMTAAQYLHQFVEVPQECRELIEKNPRLIEKLSIYSYKEQVEIMKNPMLLLALQYLLPILFQLLFKKKLGE